VNDRGLRRQILVRSISRLLDDDEEQVHDVVVLWNRHRWFYPYCAVAGVALFAVAIAAGVTGTINQVVLGGCGAAVAGMATTDHWILAKTGSGFVFCRSSRIRQYAKELVTRFDRTPKMEMVGSTVITSDWRIDGVEYTMTKRWEATMRSFT
jgi:hypothetical protein